jgi:hypothetical protein
MTASKFKLSGERSLEASLASATEPRINDAVTDFPDGT